METCAVYWLYPRSTSAKNLHHSQQLLLTFDLSCMCPKSSAISSDKYHSQDIVHGMEEKLSSTDCGSPCRMDTLKERFYEVAGSRGPYGSFINYM